VAESVQTVVDEETKLSSLSNLKLETICRFSCLHKSFSV